jgi:serine beta-lactamase-like protein LACTB
MFQSLFTSCSHYVKNAEGKIENAPFTESSFKLAGAGMLSSGADLIKFASIILYSYQHSDLNSKLKSGYLQSDTVKLLWEPIEGTAVSWHQNGSYGMGWQIVPYNENEEFTFDDMLPSSKPEMNQKKRTNTESADIRCLVGHTGGTVGASCALLILPSMTEDVNTLPPRGVAVVILANLQGLSLGGIAARIAKLFDKCP